MAVIMRLLEGLLVSLIASVLASAIVLAVVALWRRRRDKKRFSLAEGEYLEHLLDTSNGRKINPTPTGHATIEYKDDNVLSIRLISDTATDEPERTWVGTIVMDTQHHGTISWQYDDLPQGSVEFGLKRCIISYDHKMLLLLTDPPTPGYDKQILIRKQDT